MICSVKLSVSRTIVASDLFLWKESHSLVPPIPLKKRNVRPIVLVSRPLYVSVTPVENLSFKWELSELVAAKKNIIGVYLATWWALQNEFKLNWKQLLNPVVLSAVMKLKQILSSEYIEFVNMSDRDIELCVNQRAQIPFRHTLKAQNRCKIEKKEFKNFEKLDSTTVTFEAINASCGIKTIPPQDFDRYKKWELDIVKEKLCVETFDY